MQLRKKSKIFVNYILGPILFVWLSWAIYRQVKQQSDLQKSWQFIQSSFASPQSWKIWFVVVLMFFHSILEARKWQLLAQQMQPVSFMQALRSVLGGQALAFNTPNRVGEPVGRVMFLDEGNRLRGIALSIAGNISQLLITFIAGLAGLLYLRLGIPEWTRQAATISTWWYNGLALAVTIVTGLILLVYYRLSLIVRWLERWAITARYRYLVEELERLDWVELTRILSISAGRYVVFVVQYVLLLQVFDVEVSAADAACMVSVMFLLIAIIPSIAFAELGFRGQIGLQLFGLLSGNALGIVATTAGIWLINLVLPAVMGSLLLLGLRLFRTKKEV